MSSRRLFQLFSICLHTDVHKQALSRLSVNQQEISIYTHIQIRNGNDCKTGVTYIVSNGHQMYQQIITKPNNQMPRYLGHWELPQFVDLNNDNIEIYTYQNILFGTVGMPSNYLYNTVDIDEAFHMAFSISRQTTMLVHLVQTQ